MALTRFDAKINNQIDLVLDFTSDKDNIYFDPYEIDRVEILDLNGNILQTIPSGSITKVNNPNGQLIGSYKITTAVSWNTVARTVIDRWWYRKEEGSTLLPTSSSCVIRDADGIAPSSGECRKGFAFNNPDIEANGGWGAMITPDELRYVFAFGNDLVAPNNQTITDATLWWYIRTAIGNLERDLNVTLMKRILKHRAPLLNQDREDKADLDQIGEAGIAYEWEEPYDFDKTQHSRYIYLKTRYRPIIKLHKAEFRDPAGNLMIDITNWAKVNYNKGSIQFFPAAGSLESLVVYMGQTFSFDKFLGGVDYYPDAFFLDYDVGFESAAHVWKKYPELFEVAGMLSAINLLNDYGDGKTAAIASSSIGLSGISESVSTTLSATSAAFGARIKQYSDQLKNFYKENKYKYSGYLFGAL